MVSVVVEDHSMAPRLAGGGTKGNASARAVAMGEQQRLRLRLRLQLQLQLQQRPQQQPRYHGTTVDLLEEGEGRRQQRGAQSQDCQHATARRVIRPRPLLVEG